MVEAPSSSGSPWWGVVAGVLVAIVAALSKILPKRQKEVRENDASIEQIRNEGAFRLLADYRQQVDILRQEVSALRLELAQVTARYELELDAADKRNQEEGRRNWELTARYEAVLVELTQLKTRMTKQENE